MTPVTVKNLSPIDMEHSEKEGIKILVELLAAKGVKRAVLSPGSRNAPLLLSFARSPQIEHFVILDERAAAFFALGLALQSGEPVALACTSGTALLNYAPAIAEAWYQRAPLIVISADRPAAWIDQDDSQTIRQDGILNNIVKASRQLPVETRSEEERWYVNRSVNEIVNCALKGRKGPVHLNIPLSEPLYGIQNYPHEKLRTISFIDSCGQIAEPEIANLASQFRQCPKVMVTAGFGAPDKELQKALQQLSGNKNLIILTENISNLDAPEYITTTDRVLSSIPEKEKQDFAPDLVISFGGPLVSRQLKTFLRNHPPKAQWSIDNSEFPADTFKCLTAQINSEAKDFFGQLHKQLSRQDEPDNIAGCQSMCTRSSQTALSDYASQWLSLEQKAARCHESFLAATPWSDLKAFSVLLPALPSKSTLHVSNGTPVRYAQLFKHPQVAQRYGNRGTSGIEGATSVAIGIARINPATTTLITGDMSFLYDSNALWNP